MRESKDIILPTGENFDETKQKSHTLFRDLLVGFQWRVLVETYL